MSAQPGRRHKTRALPWVRGHLRVGLDGSLHLAGPQVLRGQEAVMPYTADVLLLINPVKSLERSWVGDRQAQKQGGGVLVSCWRQLCITVGVSPAATSSSPETPSAVSDREMICVRSQVLLCWMKGGTSTLESLPELRGMWPYSFVHKAKPKEPGLALPSAQHGSQI